MLKNIVLGLIFAVLLVVGCQKPAATVADRTADTTDDDTAMVAMVLCGKCGHEKGSTECCADQCELCETCKLHKGSSLCCVVAEDLRGNDMCLLCGHVAGSKECCADDCVVCTKCNMHEGSPLCCKVAVKE